MQNSAPNNQPSVDRSSQAPPQRAMTGVKKRQQIQDLNKKTFVWLAVSAVIVSICLVALQFLVREFWFNQRIINKKSDANQTLVDNIEAAEKLRDNINELLADNNLSALKYETPNAKTTALSVILDALPVEGEVTNFANSLQAVVFPRSGVVIKDLSTTTMTDLATAATGAVVAPATDQPAEVPFSAGFTGDFQKSQAALSDIARVIRPINLKKLTITATDENGLLVNIEGVTYYMPARVIEVRKEPLDP